MSAQARGRNGGSRVVRGGASPHQQGPPAPGESIGSLKIERGRRCLPRSLASVTEPCGVPARPASAASAAAPLAWAPPSPPSGSPCRGRGRPGSRRRREGPPHASRRCSPRSHHPCGSKLLCPAGRRAVEQSAVTQGSGAGAMWGCTGACSGSEGVACLCSTASLPHRRPVCAAAQRGRALGGQRALGAGREAGTGIEWRAVELHHLKVVWRPGAAARRPGQAQKTRSKHTRA